MRGLQDRVVLITGAVGGIGTATARVLREHGARVVMTDVVDRATGDAAAAELGEGVRYVPMDVTDAEMVRRVADELEADGWAVDGLFANAGIAPTAPTVDYPDETWDATIGINLTGVFHSVREFGRRMVGRGRGSIVITSSIAGERTVTPETHVAYGSTKAAVRHMAELLAVEWGSSGVRVNSVAPGYTDTSILEGVKKDAPEMLEEWISRMPLGRLNQAEEVGHAVAFLLSDLASGITGANLRVDGGYAAR